VPSNGLCLTLEHVERLLQQHAHSTTQATSQTSQQRVGQQAYCWSSLL
jgi:hypothetical protein